MGDVAANAAIKSDARAEEKVADKSDGEIDEKPRDEEMVVDHCKPNKATTEHSLSETGWGDADDLSDGCQAGNGTCAKKSCDDTNGDVPDGNSPSTDKRAPADVVGSDDLNSKQGGRRARKQQFSSFSGVCLLLTGSFCLLVKENPSLKIPRCRTN